MFRDAVTLTRQLGIRWLWIDSMCIVQDDSEDWQRESGRMADIFENALLVIGATSSRNDDGGLFGGCFGIDHALQTNGEDGSLRTEVIWECREGFECESDCAISDRVNRSGTTPKLHGSAVEKPAGRLDQWRMRVEEYSGLQLTYPKDRLPALSGLAKQTLRLRPDVYLAGLWKSSLVADLHWRLLPGSAHATKLDEYIAPSWSWASYPGAVNYIYLSGTAFHGTIDVLDAACTAAGHDATGEVLSGFVVLRGSQIPATLDWAGIPLQELRDGTSAVKLVIDGLDGDKSTERVRFYPDYALWDADEPRTFVPLHSPVFCLRLGQDVLKQHFLVLRSVRHEGRLYERIGLADIRLSVATEAAAVGREWGEATFKII
ncbi:hypothetical protein NKR23_g9084 [Pleurostoma richardsiae]|uniref:Heterokaryon incompatibility domain-containing protein n=1 Tax=Pleurostoma richardsiae TaxID=41990 RepID=A0AA38VCE9_9PEZI|nr:hypothetical protein NKR23_g9084 [Pleurostoma richardsiae]